MDRKYEYVAAKYLSWNFKGFDRKYEYVAAKDLSWNIKGLVRKYEFLAAKTSFPFKLKI